MSKNRFVKPEEIKIELSDGDWIKIRKRLTVGEERAMMTAGFKRVHHGEGASGDIEIDWPTNSLARAVTYLLDWSFKDDEGKSVECNGDAIKALDPEALDEINAAIDKHLEAMEQEKKATSGGRKLKAISQG